METKADLTPLYAILQAKETDSDRSQSNDAFDQGTAIIVCFSKKK